MDEPDGRRLIESLSGLLHGHGRRSADERDEPEWERFQRTGDVVLTMGHGILSTANRLVQSAYTGRLANATHAMMVAAPGIYLDAGPRRGVVFVPAGEFALESRPGRGRIGRRLIAVFRHPEIARSAELRRQLADAALRHLGQGYNFGFFMKRRIDVDDRTAFCGELVAKVFERLGWRLVPDRRATEVVPDRLYRALRSDPWLDVTGVYRQGLAPTEPEHG